MLQRSKFSNKVLIGLTSLGLAGAIATAPSPSDAAPASDSAEPSASQSVDGNMTAPSTPQPPALAPQPPAMLSQSETSQSSVSAQPGLAEPWRDTTERGGAIVAPGVNLSDYSDSRRAKNLTDRSVYSDSAMGPSGSSAAEGSSSSAVTDSSSVGNAPENPGSSMAGGSSAPADSGVTDSMTERNDAVRTPEAGTAQTADTRSQSLGQVVSGNADFSTLDTAIKAAGLESAFEGAEPMTVFAPTNAAFAALPADVLRQLLLPENREALRQILTYHVVQGNLTSDAIQSGTVNTAEGSDVAIANSSGTVTVSGATVTQPDIVARNGVIHAIDKVLFPPALQLQ